MRLKGWIGALVVLVCGPWVQADPHPLAHRGLCLHAPENTLPAFAAAIDLGLDLELDVYQTKDNRLVLIHDKTVDRTTNGKGKVVDKTLAELRALDAGSWFSPAYAGMKIPTFDALLTLVRKNQWRKTVIAINMKTISPGIEKRIAEALQRHGMTGQCFAFGMDEASAMRFRQADPKLAVAILARDAAAFETAVGNPGYESIWYYVKPSKTQIDAAHAAGKRVWLSGDCIKGDPGCWRNAKETGADGVCVNHPLEARESWRQMSFPGVKRPSPPFSVAATAVPLKGPDSRPIAKTPEVLTHRGLSKYAPENTLPAIAAAVSLGLGIEIDVYQTRDDHLVIIHDGTVDRTTNGKGKVTDKTLAELKALDAGSWFDPAFAGVKIPTFEEVLQIVRERQWRPTWIAINMKTISPGIEGRIARAVEKHDMLDHVFAFGMNEASAERFRAANPKLPLSLHNRDYKEWPKLITAGGYTSVWMSDSVTKENVSAAHKADRQVHVFGPCIGHAPKAWEHALRIGADSVCVDHPLEVRKLWYKLLKEKRQSKLPGDGVWIETPAGKPVIDRGPPGAWDHYAVDNPYLLVHNNRYYCFYEAQDKSFAQGGHERVGLATSADTVHWTKYENNPVLDVGAPGTWDDIVAKLPNVFAHDGMFYMYYSGRNKAGKQIGLATSTDLKNWIKHPANPILSRRPGRWDAQLSTHPAPVFRRGNQFFLLYRGMKGLYHDQKLGLAASTDLVHWKRFRDLPLLSAGEECFSLAVAESAGRYFAIMQAPKRKYWYSEDLLAWRPGPEPQFTGTSVDTLSNPVRYGKDWIVLYEQKDRIYRAIYRES